MTDIDIARAGVCIADLLSQIHGHTEEFGEADFFTGDAWDLLKELFPITHDELVLALDKKG